MSNELNNIIARNSDGVYEGVAIGGDRYPGTRFIDHLLRYQDNPTVSVRMQKPKRSEAIANGFGGRKSNLLDLTKVTFETTAIAQAGTPCISVHLIAAFFCFCLSC